jgi:hypothetical protein
MAVPASGQLKLWDDIWNQEIGAEKGNNSLHSASIYAGFSVPDAMSDFYGWADIIPPSVSTTSFTSPQYTCVIANGNITATGNGTPLSRGFYIGTNSASAPSNTKYTIAGTQPGTGAFTYTLTGRTQNTTYYAWAWASNSAGESLGDRLGVTTPFPPFSPTVGPGTRCAGTPATIGCFTSFIGYINPYSSAYVQEFAFSAPDGDYQTVNCGTPTGGATNARNRMQSNMTQTPGYPSQTFVAARNHVGLNTCQPGTGPSFYNGGGGNTNWCANGYDVACLQYCQTSDIRLKTNINYL